LSVVVVFFGSQKNLSRHTPPDRSDASSEEETMDLEGHLIGPRDRGAAMKTIARLNDGFRSVFVMTAPVKALPVEMLAPAIVAVQAFTVFTENNDPCEEHDCASFTLNRQRFFRTIDYYDETCTYASNIRIPAMGL
jgi:hypothetical protein